MKAGILIILALISLFAFIRWELVLIILGLIIWSFAFTTLIMKYDALDPLVKRLAECFVKLANKYTSSKDTR